MNNTSGYRVMLVVQSLRVGGAENMVETLSYALHDKGCNVRVVVLQSEETMISERMRNNGLTPVMLGKRQGIDLSVISRLAQQMKEFEPDVVHSHLPILHYVVPAAWRAHAVNCVHTIHSLAQKETRSRLKSGFARYCYRRGLVRPVALSEKNKQTVVDFYGIAADAVAVVPNGVDLKRYRPLSDYALGQTIHVCHIGRFEEAKNHDALIETGAILRQHDIDIVFDLYGVGSLQEYAKQKARDLGVSDMFVFHGITGDTPTALHESNLFVFPSLWEGMPMVIAEAMATGLPIVASNVGGIPDMLRDGTSALLCEPEPHAIAACVERLVKDEGLRRHIGMNALRSAPNFGVNLMVERYMAVYERGVA